MRPAFVSVLLSALNPRPTLQKKGSAEPTFLGWNVFVKPEPFHIFCKAFPGLGCLLESPFYLNEQTGCQNVCPVSLSIN